MYGFLLAILILDGLFLGVVVLLQSGKGGGLAAMGGSGTSPADGVLGGRQATSLLTRATWTSGTVFMVLALVLSIMSSRSALPTSVLRPETQQAAPAPVLPGLEEGAAPVEIPGATGDTGGGQESGGTPGN